MKISWRISSIIFTVIAVCFLVLAIHSFMSNNVTIHTPLAKAGGINVAISATDDGFISNIYVKSYQKVNKGDLMFKLEDRDIIIGVEAAKLKIESLNRKIEAKRQAAEYDKARVKALEERLESEQLELKNITRQVEMYGSLSDKNAISKNEYLNWKSKEIVAEQKILSSRSDIMALQSSLLEAQEKKEIAELELQIALKEMEYFQIKLSETEIRAPADGYTESINVIPGQYVTNGFLITRLDILIDGHTPVTALFSEDQIKRVSQDDEVYIRFNIDPSKVYRGYITGVAKTTLNTEQSNKLVGVWDVSASQIRQAKKYVEVYIDIPETVFINGVPVVEGMSANVIIKDK